jgi:hypothetical protein
MRRPNRRQAIVAGVAATGGALALAAGEAIGGVFAVRGNDAASVERAVGECLKSGGGTVYLPAGSYRLDKRLVVDLPAGTGIAFRGDGPGLSKLTWAGKSAGIEIRFRAEGGLAGNAGAVIVDGLSLLATAPDAGSAVRLVSDGGTSPSPKKLVRDLVLAGWDVGVDCNDCTFTTIDAVDFQGPRPLAGVAVRFDGTHDPVDNYVTRLRVFGAKHGVEVLGNSEGVYVSQSTVIGVERGVHWHTPRGEPLLSLTGTHIASSRDCVYGRNLIQPLITGNLLYQSGALPDGEWAGIRLDADEPSIYDLIQVSQNTIHAFPKLSQGGAGVVISNRTGGIVQSNIVQGARVGIRLDRGTSEVNVLDNLVRQFTEADVRDGGERNVIRRV